MDEIEYLDKAKQVLGLTSDYALSIELGITRSAVSSYRKKRTNFDEYACFRIAEILNIEPSKVITDIRSQSEKNEDKKEFWIEQRKKYQQGLGLFAIWGIAGEILREISKPYPYSHNTYYVKCKWCLISCLDADNKPSISLVPSVLQIQVISSVFFIFSSLTLSFSENLNYIRSVFKTHNVLTISGIKCVLNVF